MNSRLLLHMMTAHAARAWCARRSARPETLDRDGEGFVAGTADGDAIRATRVVVAGVEVVDRGKSFVDADDRGRTGVPGLYAAGRLAFQPYQVIVVTGHGASVGLAVVEDADVPYYHYWVAPDRYFTGRDREVPPGCEEIDEATRRRRERESLEVMRAYFEEPHPDEPVQHPSVRES